MVNKNKKKILIVAISSSLFLLLLGIIIGSYNYAYKDKIFPKTFVGEENLGGKTLKEAEEILKNKADTKNDNEIELKYLDQSWKINTKELEVKLHSKDSAMLAWKVGRSGGFGKIIKEQLKSIFSSNHYLAVFDINEEKFNENIIKIASDIYVPEKDATIEVNNNEVKVASEQYGKKLNILATQDNLLKIIGSFKSVSLLNLDVVKLEPIIFSEEANQKIITAQKIIKEKYILKSENKSYEINNNDLANWITFIAVPQETTNSKIDLKKSTENTRSINWVLSLTVDQGEILSYLNEISRDINSEPQDAKFQVENGKVTTFQVSKTGYKLETDKSALLISNAILDGLSKEIILAVEIKKPEIASDSAESMGLIELVGEGKSSWRGSPANRIHNLTLGSQKISGTIIKPGEEFSTIKTIGQIDGSTGFLPELVIKNSTEVTPEFGGGLCQVSTTLFRAAINSGLKITQREPHSFRVSYYEPPVGMDATIYDPSPDLKFVNTYNKPILIWAISSGNSLTFQFFGTKDGRNINISNPNVYNYVSPPPPVYKESASLGQGEIKQIERALSGCTASFSYQVTDSSGKEIEKETFVSKYVALPNTYLYGPGTTLPSE